MNENQTQFGQQQDILKSLTSVYEPILQAGPSQKGFSAAESTAMNTQAMDGSANAYQHADQALNNQYAAEGGGSEYIPSGAQTQMNEGVATAAAGELAGAQNQITQENYAQGNQNFNNAASVLSGSSQQLGTTGATAGAATGAAGSAFTAATGVNNANNSLLNGAMGILGSAAGGIGGALTAGVMGGKK